MDTKKKALIVSAILIGLGGYYIYKNMKSKPAVEVSETPENQKGTIDTTKELSKGSTGEEVKRLQTALNGLLVDGNFGSLTEARLKVVTGKTSISLRGYNDYMANKTAKK